MVHYVSVTDLYIWVLESYEEGTWVKKHSINIHSIERYHLNELFTHDTHLSAIITANARFCWLSTYLLYTYDPTTGTLRRFDVQSANDYKYCNLCTMSLIPLVDN